MNEIMLPDWIKTMQTSAMENLVGCAAHPDMISFALGLPNFNNFPHVFFKEAVDESLSQGISIFQYGPPLAELKHQIVKLMKLRNIECHPNQILITAGAQQGINLLIRLLLQPNGKVITEELTYPGMLQALTPYSPTILTVPTDLKTGINVSTVKQILSQHRPAFLYLVSDGGNPHGASISLEKRMQLAELAEQYQFPIIEDDPYGFLSYEKALPPIKHFSEKWVFYVGSFSKIFAPSLRVGWVVVPEKLVPVLSSLKESSDINIATFSQHILQRLLNKINFNNYIETLRSGYILKRDQLMAALQKYLPADCHFVTPKNGIFLWAYFKKEINTSQLLTQAIKQKILFVPSQAFAASEKIKITNGIRFNFSCPELSQITEGVKRFAMALRSEEYDVCK